MTDSYNSTTGILTYTPSVYGADSKTVIADPSNRFSDVDVMLQFPFACIDDTDKICVDVTGCSSLDSVDGERLGVIKINHKYIDVGIFSYVGYGIISYVWATYSSAGIMGQTISIVDATSIELR
jgi:hypothetical protein